MNALDHDSCYRAVSSKDARFDGCFFTAVRTTGIYCRPSCPAVTPKRRNVEFFRTAAAAHDQGYRACKRCRPDASPGSPEWDRRGDVVSRAMRLMADGTVDRDGVGGLARRLHYSERHLTRLVSEQLGSGPLAIARALRATTARVLIETSDLSFTTVAFAAGFGSVRQFNDTVREVFASSPTALREAATRRARRGAPLAQPGTVDVDLAVRTPYDFGPALEFLAARAIPGVEHVDGGRYERTLGLPHGHGIVTVSGAATAVNGRAFVRAQFRLQDWRDLAPAVRRIRRLFDLDADPVAVDDVLGSDPALAHLVLAAPGRRVPGSVEPFETAVRAVIGQQISVRGARTIAGRLVAAEGMPLGLAHPTLTHVFPSPDAIGEMDSSWLPMPTRRRDTVVDLATRISLGKVSLDVGADRADVRSSLLEVPGIGPWTADYVIMRGLGDPDVFLATDLGAKHAMARVGLSAGCERAWSPWRSYALHHLWAALEPVAPEPARHPVDPPTETGDIR